MRCYEAQTKYPLGDGSGNTIGLRRVTFDKVPISYVVLNERDERQLTVVAAQSIFQSGIDYRHLIPILRGGVVQLRSVTDKLDAFRKFQSGIDAPDCIVDSMRIRFYKSDGGTEKIPEITQENKFPVGGQDILAVEEILDTHGTMIVFKDYFNSKPPEDRPNSIGVFALMDKLKSRSVREERGDNEPYFVGVQVENEWGLFSQDNWVSCMEIGQMWREKFGITDNDELFRSLNFLFGTHNDPQLHQEMTPVIETITNRRNPADLAIPARLLHAFGEKKLVSV